MKNVEVYRNQDLAGIFTEENRNSYSFRYDDIYYADPSKQAISLTLSKKKQEYRANHLFPFFFNLLSEGANRKLQSRTLKIDEADNFGLPGMEDFATLVGKSNDTGGANFKYDYSYEEATALLVKYVPSWRVEMEKMFSLIVFNYLFSNGDAHLKNFALLESERGDHFLSPAYDLINTRIHEDDTDFALDKGLFADNFKSSVFKKTNHRGQQDFLEFAHRIGLKKKRAQKLLAPFTIKQEKVEILIARSFLDQATKRAYALDYSTRRNSLVKE